MKALVYRDHKNKNRKEGIPATSKSQEDLMPTVIAIENIAHDTGAMLHLKNSSPNDIPNRIVDNVTTHVSLKTVLPNKSASKKFFTRFKLLNIFNACHTLDRAVNKKALKVILTNE